MTTKIIYVDDKWTYYLHKFIVKNQITSTLLVRTGAVRNGKLIRSEEIRFLILIFQRLTYQYG